MKITVFGASGKVGRIVVDLLQADNHDLTLFIHTHNPFTENNNLKIVHGDINSSKDIDLALNNSDLVISTLGSWGTKNKNVLSTSMNQIIPALKRNNIKRIISLTGADARCSADKSSLISSVSHLIFGILVRKILIDGEKHIKLLEDSGLDFTIIRSPVMTKGGQKKSYKLNLEYAKPWETIGRNNVAEALVAQINETKYVQLSPFIHKKD